MSPTDWELVQRANAGDRRAFHDLVDRYASKLYQLATIMTGNHADAQDLVQETFLGAYEAMPGFEGRSSVKTWLTGIMIRQASLQRRKSHRSRQMASLDHADALEPVDRRSMGAGNPMAQADARFDLASLMGQLSEEHRQVLALRELQGLSYDEIAQVTGQPRGTVESRLFRARQMLKSLAMRTQAAEGSHDDGGVA